MRKSISFLLAIFAFVAVVPSFVACENEDEDIKQEPQITLTTNKKVGETITLRFSEDNMPTEVIGAKKINEEEINLDGSVFEAGVVDVTYTLTSQTVIIKGNIIRFRCWDNGLTVLDVSRCPNLTLLQCDKNQLTQLDVSKNMQLERLSCSNNNITTLNVSKNSELKTLHCYHNKLTSLNIGNNPKLNTLNCEHNKIKAAEMSKIINALPDWNGKKIETDWGYAQSASLYVISTDSSEENEISEADIKIAQDKNWRFE